MPLLQAKKSLSKLFGGSPIFLFDKQELLGLAKQVGVEAVHIDTIGAACLSSHDGLIFVFSNRNLNDEQALLSYLSKGSVLQFPLHAFNGNLKNCLYTLNMCKNFDVENAVKLNNQVVSVLASKSARFDFLSPRNGLKIDLNDNIKIMEVATNSMLGSDEDLAFSAFSEVALIPFETTGTNLTPEKLGYKIEGSLAIDGTLCAVHRGAPTKVVDQNRVVEDFFCCLHKLNEFPMRAEIKNSKLSALFTRSGTDLSAMLIAGDAPIFNGTILELAVGTNASMNGNTIDWSFNSPVNEFALGFHIAIGDGIRCPHIDLISIDPVGVRNLLRGIEYD